MTLQKYTLIMGGGDSIVTALFLPKYFLIQKRCYELLL